MLGSSVGSEDQTQAPMLAKQLFKELLKLSVPVLLTWVHLGKHSDGPTDGCTDRLLQNTLAYNRGGYGEMKEVMSSDFQDSYLEVLNICPDPAESRGDRCRSVLLAAGADKTHGRS